MARLNIDEYLMGIARVVRTRSDWPGTKVGCVAAVDGMIRSTGYNGTPKGWKGFPGETLPEDWEGLQLVAGRVRAYFCHAEENSIVQAARAGIRLEGASFYTTLSPCLPCARMMVNVGAARLLFLELWHGAESAAALTLLGDAGVVIQKLEV